MTNGRRTASPLQRAGSMETNESQPKRLCIWPGMPTRRSQMFEFVLGFFPGWIALLGIAIALLLPLMQTCREVLQQ
jgi:hypothetical protein